MDEYIQLAKQAVEAYIRRGITIDVPSGLPKEMLKKKAGVFTTLEKKGGLRDMPSDSCKRILRGCIGTYLPTRKNIAEEIIENAIAAATRDYRFGPVSENELPLLFYTIYILSPLEEVGNKEQLDPQKYGVFVRAENPPLRSGLLLPGLDNIRTPEEQISIACQKGGINPKEEIVIYRFKVEKHSQPINNNDQPRNC